MSINRNAVLDKVAARLRTIPGIRTVLLRPQLQQDIAAVDQPVAILVTRGETAEPTSGAGTRFTVHYMVGIGVHDASPAGPRATLLSLVDAVEDAFRSPLEGGLDAEIAGEVSFHYGEGASGEAVLPLDVITH